MQRDAKINAFIKQHVESAYRPCGAARLGLRDDPMAVANADCRVIGVERLRVADSLIFLRVTNGNLKAASIMLGKRRQNICWGGCHLRLPISSCESIRRGPAANVIYALMFWFDFRLISHEIKLMPSACYILVFNLALAKLVSVLA